MPLLEVDGKILVQSGAILRFVAKKCGKHNITVLKILYEFNVSHRSRVRVQMVELRQ